MAQPVRRAAGRCFEDVSPDRSLPTLARLPDCDRRGRTARRTGYDPSIDNLGERT